MKRLGQQGQGLTEYLILLLLISMASLATAKALGGIIKSKLEEAKRHINSQITLKE
jgi:Flp pilus assembly pilin Flp